MDKSEIRNLIEAIHDSSKNTFDLLSGLLQWAQSQIGSLKVYPVMISLPHMAEEMEELFVSSLQNKSQVLVKNIPDDLHVYADYSMFATILRNLFSNAIKFSSRGGAITIAAALDGPGHILVSVADNGVGISAENQKKLFRIDTQVSTYGTADETGTGLGLILCKELVERNNGEIRLESEPGKGTVFFLRLPSAAG